VLSPGDSQALRLRQAMTPEELDEVEALWQDNVD
jgi:hypothetical protein